MQTVHVEYEGDEYEFDCILIPGKPGRTWGPPEDCYEDEPSEFDIENVRKNDELLSDPEIRDLPQDLIDMAEVKALQEYEADEDEGFDYGQEY